MDNQELSIWNDSEKLQTIKTMYASNLSVGEFQAFLEIGKRTGLNPFLRELWAVKYKGPAQIFIGRDGYRTIIGRNPNYEYHIADAVYSNDEFTCDLINGSVQHEYSLQDRGKLVGAYCLVKMKSSKIPFYVFAEFKEYNQGQSLWLSKPATMIKKVAESQCIRMAIPSELNGTYSPEEFGNNPDIQPKVKEEIAQLTLEELKDQVSILIEEKKVDDETLEKWCAKGNVKNIYQLTYNQILAIKNKLENES